MTVVCLLGLATAGVATLVHYSLSRDASRNDTFDANGLERTTATMERLGAVQLRRADLPNRNSVVTPEMYPSIGQHSVSVFYSIQPPDQTVKQTLVVTMFESAATAKDGMDYQRERQGESLLRRLSYAGASGILFGYPMEDPNACPQAAPSCVAIAAALPTGDVIVTGVTLSEVPSDESELMSIQLARAGVRYVRTVLANKR
jgi:hypothetical protein